MNQCRDFAKQYNADGGDATVVYLPDHGITGNSHFMFQEMNNGEIADSRYMSEEAFAKATSTVDKELFIVPGATHIRTYFVKEYVNQIAAKIQKFFTDKL